MYLDDKQVWRPIEPSKPNKAVTRREEKVILWLISANAIALLVAPIGGATLIQALIAIVRG